MSEPSPPGRAVTESTPREEVEEERGPAGDLGFVPAATEEPVPEPAATEGAVAEPEQAAGETAAAEAPAEPEEAAEPTARRRRRNRLAAALIGILTLLLGFAFAVQVRSTDTDQQLSGAREEDLVHILDELSAKEDRLRAQIADQRAAIEQLGSSDSRSSTALQEARQRAQAIGILNGTVAAQGPGLRMVIRDPVDAVRVSDLLDAIEELRGAGAETMQIDGIRVGVSTAVTGSPGTLQLDGHPLTSPYVILVIGSPQGMETAMNIPGGVVQRITGRGGSVTITQQDQVVVDALRPLDQPKYSSPKTGG